MDWLKEIMYFKLIIIPLNDINTKKIIFIPKELIHDIYFDNTTNFIPYTNGKCYLVYQDLTFKIIEYLEKSCPNVAVQLNKEVTIPEIIITGNIDDVQLSRINRIMTNYINLKFSLFIGQTF